MAFRLVGQWASDAARVIVRAPRQIREYCRQIPVGPEGDYRREVNAFNRGVVAVGVPYILWAQYQYLEIVESS